MLWDTVPVLLYIVFGVRVLLTNAQGKLISYNTSGLFIVFYYKISCMSRMRVYIYLAHRGTQLKTVLENIYSLDNVSWLGKCAEQIKYILSFKCSNLINIFKTCLGIFIMDNFSG